MRAMLLLWTAAAAFGQQDEVLARARARLADAAAAVPKYTCTQTVDRSYFRETRQRARACDAIVANDRHGRSKLALTSTDRLRFEVEVTDGGYEVYAWPGAARIADDKVEKMAGGPFGTGPFGPFLIEIFTNPAVEFQRLGGSEYRYRVPLEASHYRVRAGVTWRMTGYDGTFRVDAASAELQRLVVRTAELPPATGSCEATTTMDFERLRIGGGEYLLPRETHLRIIGRDANVTENATAYRDCREFHGESAVRFDEPGAEAGVAAKPVQATAPALPGGIPLALVLDSEIDCDRAAAGDAIAARVGKRVVDPKTRRVLVEAGATVRGRITLLEHHIDDGNYFLVGVTFETLETPGGIAPLTAILDSTHQVLDSRKPVSGRGLTTESRSGLPEGGTFVFPARESKYVVRRGHLSNWITLTP